jgi:hypothetical protein
MNGACRARLGWVAGAFSAVTFATPLGSPAAAALLAQPRVICTSPCPDARYVLPASTIIVRFDRALDRDASSLPVAISAEGSASAAHEGRLVLTDDGRTVIFKPRTPFDWGEKVTVRVTSGSVGGVAPERAAQSYSFSVSDRAPLPVPPEAMDEPSGVDPAAVLNPFEASPLSKPHHESALTAGFPVIVDSVFQAPAPGRLFMSHFAINNSDATPYLLILDDLGQPIFYREMKYACLDFKMQPSGQLTYYDSAAHQFYAMDSSYAVVDSFQCGNGYTADTHELRILPNGHALLMSYDPETVDMSTVVAGGNPAATVIGLIIQELDTAKNVVFQWRSWDHFQITDATHENLLASSIDYVHGNAIEADTDGNVIISCRHMDEITKIDRGTGNIIWRWGGKNNQFAFVGDNIGFSHQHAIRRIASGNVTLFDNGNFHTPPFSRAVEYTLDEVNHVATLVWQFRNTPDSFGLAMGYVQRLDNGSTLIGWGTGKPDVIEVKPDGTKVMELWLPESTVSYRSFRFNWDPNASVLGATVPEGLFLSRGRPNPSVGLAEVNLSLARITRVSLKVYDITGRQVSSLMDGGALPAGLHTFKLDLTHSPSGIYFCRLNAGGQAQTQKIVVAR